MKSTISFIISALAILFTIDMASAQMVPVAKQDPLFPEQGKTMVTVWSGIPFIAIGEYAYGVSDGFAVAVIGGYTPTTKAIGIRLRGIVAQPSDDFRLYLKGPVIYYPGSPDSHNEPWFLAWPTLNAEWKLQNDTRIWTGVGLIGAACAQTLLGKEDAEMEMGGGFHGGLWNTLQLGMSMPVIEKMAVHAEVAYVMSGLKHAGDPLIGRKGTDLYWDGGLPLIIDVGMSYAF